MTQSTVSTHTHIAKLLSTGQGDYTVYSSTYSYSLTALHHKTREGLKYKTIELLMFLFIIWQKLLMSVNDQTDRVKIAIIDK
jgi:hypothetical protein